MDKAKRAKDTMAKREIIERLYGLWLQHPEMRLTQLVRNAYPADYNLYHVEDFEFIEELERAYKDWPKS